MGLRVGAVIAARKSGYKLTKKPSELDELQFMSDHPSHEQIYDFDIKESTKQKLVFRKYPCIEWSLALAFLSAFAFCEYMVCWTNVEKG